MNDVTGDVSKVSDTGTAAQHQALFQKANGNVDEDDNPTDNGGNVTNIASQTAQSIENSTVRHVTTIDNRWLIMVD